MSGQTDLRLTQMRCAQRRDTVIINGSLVHDDDETLCLGASCINPDLPNCPACGGSVLQVPNFGGYVTCTGKDCHVSGPDNDPRGKKWVRMCANLKR